MRHGRVIPPQRTFSSRFAAYQSLLRALPRPLRARLTGDDRMAADREQLPGPPNSPGGLLRPATRIFITLVNWSNTNNNIGATRPSVTARA